MQIKPRRIKGIMSLFTAWQPLAARRTEQLIGGAAIESTFACVQSDKTAATGKRRFCG
jgi:hypothetical protein